MPVAKQVKEYIEKELPYKILMKVYEDSRSSLKDMGRELNISYQIVGRILKKLEAEYKISYVLELNEQALGFTEGRLISIKFAKMPDIEMLKERFLKDIFIQDAYLCSGDFDLLLYVVGLTNKDFDAWQFNLRVDLHAYGPNLRMAILNQYRIGFFPLRNELLSESNVLSNSEKKVLLLLNENSRMKLGDIIKKSRLTQMRVVYTMRKLRERQIIKKYSALVQDPEKHTVVSYALSHMPVKGHEKLLLVFFEKMIQENFHESASDYSLMCNTNGFCDLFFICIFENGEIASKRGADILNELWSVEHPKIEKAVLTSLLIGKWPFHLERYKTQAKEIVSIKKKL